jgi:hypothetical protein
MNDHSTTEELLAAVRERLIVRGDDTDEYNRVDTANSALDALAARLEAAEWSVERLRETLHKLSKCVMDGWTDPAFVRGNLHLRAVEIASAVLEESE